MIKEWFKKYIWQILSILLVIIIIIFVFMIGDMLGVIDWTPRNMTEWFKI